MAYSRCSQKKGSRLIFISISLLLLSLLCACNSSGAQRASSTPGFLPAAAQTPSASAVHRGTGQTSQPVETLSPSLTPNISTPKIIAPSLTANRYRPSDTPATETAIGTPGKQLSITPNSLQSLLILDPIQIRAPGPGSQVISPIRLEINFQLDPTTSLVRIELRRPDGVLLARKLLDGSRLDPPGDLLIDALEFEIAEPTSHAWLIVAVEPKRKTENQPVYPLAVNSADLTLSSTGPARLAPPSWQAKTIDIQQPAAEASISGGILQVSGLTNLNPDLPLKVQIVDQNGKLISQRLAGIHGAAQDGFMEYSTEIAYQIHQPVSARVVVFRDDPETGLVLHLANQPVQLKP